MRTSSEREYAQRLARIAYKDALAAMSPEQFQRVLTRHFMDGTCHIEDEKDRKQTMLDLAYRVRTGEWRFIKGRR